MSLMARNQSTGAVAGAVSAKLTELMIPQGRERFDVLVVPPPAARDDMVIKVREPLLKQFDPGTEFVPMLGDLGGRNVRPVRRSWHVIHVVYVEGVEDRLDSIELKPWNDSVVRAGVAHADPSRTGSAVPNSSKACRDSTRTWRPAAMSRGATSS